MERRVWYEISYLKANEILDDLDKRCYKFVNAKSEDFQDELKVKFSGFTCFIRHNQGKNSIYDTIQYKLGGRWYNYKINKSIIRDYDFIQREANVATAASVFSRMVKFKHIKLPMSNLGAVHYANEKYMNMTLPNCIGYDRNKAFLATCIDLLVPTDYLGELYRCPKEDEIGFNGNGIPHYGPCNDRCRWIFKAGYNDSLTRWAYHMIDRLKNASTKEQKAEVKSDICCAIRNLGNNNYQEHNNRPLCNTIVYTSNKFIEDLMDENTLYSNTDSLVSLVPRPELAISDNVGDFKIEHKGSFFYTDSRHYQWNRGEVNGATDSLQLAWEKDHGRSFELGKDDLSELFEYKPIFFNERTFRYEEKVQ